MKRRLIGVVSSSRLPTTRRVEVEWVFRHRIYGKIVRRTMVCHAHDANGSSKQGDTVELVESRPLSKLKRWALVRVI